MKAFIGCERIVFILLPVAVLACSPASLPPEQISEQLVTVEDYRRAEQSLAANTSKIVYDVIINEYWQEDERLVYQKSTSQGYNYILVDLTSNGKSPLFDHARLAESLSTYTEKDTKGNNLDLTQIEITDDREFVEFNFEESRYRLNLISYALQLLEDGPQNEYLMGAKRSI